MVSEFIDMPSRTDCRGYRSEICESVSTRLPLVLMVVIRPGIDQDIQHLKQTGMQGGLAAQHINVPDTVGSADGNHFLKIFYRHIVTAGQLPVKTELTVKVASQGGVKLEVCGH